MDALKGLGFVDADGKFTDKMGESLTGKDAKLLVDTMKGASMKEPPTLDIIAQILGTLKNLISGSQKLHVIEG